LKGLGGLKKIKTHKNKRRVKWWKRLPREFVQSSVLGGFEDLGKALRNLVLLHHS